MHKGTLSFQAIAKKIVARSKKLRRRMFGGSGVKILKRTSKMHSMKTSVTKIGSPLSNSSKMKRISTNATRSCLTTGTQFKLCLLNC